MVSTDVEFVVSPFTVAIDSREQAPWTFRGLHADAKDNNRPLLVLTVEKCLVTGDYSIEGLEDIVSIERKSHSDLLSSITHGRERFEAEFDRMSKLTYAAVVVEASIAEILHRPPLMSRVNPKAVIRTAISWSIRYGVHWWFAPSRSHAETMCYRILEQFWKQHKESLKAKE